MAKDPRFNFYPDNYMGGTLGFSLEQHGAYLQLIILQSKLMQFTAEQAINHIATFYRGNYHGATELWNFLLPKFETNGTHFWNARLRKEMEKSKKHSELQSNRVKSRYSKNNGSTAVVPDNSNGIGNGIGSEEKGVQGETILPLSDKWFDAIIDEIQMENLVTTFRDKDIAEGIKTFKAKARAAPDSYRHRDNGGIMLAIHDHIRKSKSIQKNGTHRNSSAIITTGRTAGNL